MGKYIRLPAAAVLVFLIAGAASAIVFQVDVVNPDYNNIQMITYSRDGNGARVTLGDVIRNSRYTYKIVAAFHSG